MKKKRRSAPRPDTWMPMFWGDYARDTGHLGNGHHGAYLMLIKHYWCSGEPLVDDDAVLWRIACCDSIGAWKKLRPTVARFFKVDAGLWRHKRVDAELEHAKEIVEARSSAGLKGAEARWQGDDKPDGNGNADANGIRMANAPPSQWQSDGQPPSPSPSQEAASAASGAAPEPARRLIEVFDEALEAAFGRERRRPHPAAKDLVFARRFAEAGADPELCRSVFEAAQRRKLAAGDEPIGSLAFFEDRIPEALRAGAKPLGSPNGHAVGSPESRRLFRLQKARDHTVGRSAETWRNFIRFWRKNPKDWGGELSGPPPDHPDCVCPPAILAEFGYGPDAPLPSNISDTKARAGGAG